MNKRIFILSLVVLILGLVVFVLETRDVPKTSDLFYPHLKLDQISKIEIEHFTRATRLAKDENGVWWVSDFKNESFKRIETLAKDPPRIDESKKELVDSVKMEQLLDMIIEMKKGKPVATNPEKFRELKLEEPTLTMSIYDIQGNLLSRLLIGNQGPQLITTFVRESNSNEAYLVDQYLAGLLSQSTQEWSKP